MIVTGQMRKQRPVCYVGHHNHPLPLLHAQSNDGEDVAVHHACHEVDFVPKLRHLYGPDARCLREKRRVGECGGEFYFACDDDMVRMVVIGVVDMEG